MTRRPNPEAWGILHGEAGGRRRTQQRGPRSEELETEKADLECGSQKPRLGGGGDQPDQMLLMGQENLGLGLPWWHSSEESACQCRGHGFEPWPGKILHAVEQLSPCATTTEPAI